METKEIILPEGWEIDKIENGKIVLKETKKELPTTWVECCKLLKEGEYISSNSCINHLIINSDFDNLRDMNTLPVGFGKPMLALCQLLICREVYRQGWIPDWKDIDNKFCICVIENNIVKTTHFHTKHLLSFQSEEVRDQFLENFKDLIEEAKELI